MNYYNEIRECLLNSEINYYADITISNNFSIRQLRN